MPTSANVGRVRVLSIEGSQPLTRLQCKGSAVVDGIILLVAVMLLWGLASGYGPQILSWCQNTYTTLKPVFVGFLNWLQQLLSSGGK